MKGVDFLGQILSHCTFDVLTVPRYCYLACSGLTPHDWGPLLLWDSTSNFLNAVHSSHTKINDTLIPMGTFGFVLMLCLEVNVQISVSRGQRWRRGCFFTESMARLILFDLLAVSLPSKAPLERLNLFFFNLVFHFKWPCWPSPVTTHASICGFQNSLILFVWLQASAVVTSCCRCCRL